MPRPEEMPPSKDEYVITITFEVNELFQDSENRNDEIINYLIEQLAEKKASLSAFKHLLNELPN